MQLQLRAKLKKKNCSSSSAKLKQQHINFIQRLIFCVCWPFLTLPHPFTQKTFLLLFFREQNNGKRKRNVSHLAPGILSPHHLPIPYRNQSPEAIQMGPLNQRSNNRLDTLDKPLPPEPIQFAPLKRFSPYVSEHHPRPPPYDVEKRRTILINYHLKLESIITSVGLYSPFGWPTGCCATLHLPWAGQSIREESVKISEIFIHHRLYNNSNNLLGWLFFEKRYDNDE